MKRKMEDYKEPTQRLYQVPKNVQELVPIHRISKDGIFELEKKPEEAFKLYDKAYLFFDANFAVMDETEKEEMLKLQCINLNSLSVSYKILVMNMNRDMEQVRKSVYIRNKNPKYKDLIQSINQRIEDALVKGQSGIEQIRIFILTCRRQNEAQARDYFRSVEANQTVNFKKLGSTLIPLDATERLRVLHSFYRMGEEEGFKFDFEQAIHRKRDWRNVIAPRIVKHYQDEYGAYDGITVQMGDNYVRALYVPALPSSIDTDIIRKLTGGSYRVIITCDVAAIPTSVAKRKLTDLYMQNGRAIQKQQENMNKVQAWSNTVSYDLRRNRDELENNMDIMNENGEKLSYLGLYAVIIANSKRELENAVTAFCSTAEGEGFQFKPAYWEQLDVINTALPIGVRFCTMMNAVFTQPLAALMPFVVHELYQEGGIFYGINQISKNVLIGDRKKLKNGNGLILGDTGAGKSEDEKQEITQVFLQGKDDIIIIDPQHEYEDIAKYLGGEFIDFGSGSGHYINPLDADNLPFMDSKDAFLRDKSELLLGIFSQILDNGITGQDKSIIGRCVRKVYENLDKNGKNSPTLLNLYAVLDQQPEIQAREMKLALELFVTGPLDMFSVKTNVNTKNRLIVYGIANLGKEQAGIGMLIMLESIRARIAMNAKKGKATWLVIDEFHNLVNNEFSAAYMEKIWKEVRKMGGLCTAITQNIADLLGSKVVETMLCNSEYLCLLKQSELEIDILKKVLRIPDNLLQYVHNSEPGCGLLKFGEKYIPKDNRLPKTNEMYKLFNTNFHELQEQKKLRRNLKKEVGRMPEAVREVIAADPTEAEKIYLE